MGFLDDEKDEVPVAETGIMIDGFSSVELGLIGRVNGYFSLIEGFWRKIVIAAGPDASGKIIRVVAKEAWPEVRRKLGL